MTSRAPTLAATIALTNITVNKNRWPLVTATFQGSPGLEQVTGYYRALEAFLAEAEPFGLVMVLRERSPGSDAETAKFQKAWLKTHRLQLEERCAGVAVVLADDALFGRFGPVMGRATAQLMGCPAEVFRQVVDAEAWVEARLASEVLAGGAAGAP